MILKGSAENEFYVPGPPLDVLSWQLEK